MRLSSISYFRAIAIILIVAGHCYPTVDLELVSWPTRYAANLLTGGTTFFVFISGYMFNHVFAPRFEYRQFMAAKCRNVLMPYLALAVPMSIYFVLRHPQDMAEVLGPADPALQTVKALATGYPLVGYWFIPFILVMFLASPLHMRFIALAPMVRVAIVFLSLIVALFVQRPVENLNVFQSVLYFTPVYLIGILASIYREPVLAALRGREYLLFAMAFAIAAVQTSMGLQGNGHKPMFTFAGIDLMLLQKLFLTIAIYATLERCSVLHSQSLLLVSEASFAIFFLHPIVLILLGWVHATHLTGWPWVDLVLVSMETVMICVAIAVTARRFLSHRSRLLLGY